MSALTASSTLSVRGRAPSQRDARLRRSGRLPVHVSASSASRPGGSKQVNSVSIAPDALDVGYEEPCTPDRGSIDMLSVSTPSRFMDLSSVMDPPSCTITPKKTHIICTLGPSSRTVEQISDLLYAGMGVARFNFSHGSHEYHQETLDNLNAACEATGKMCAVLLDTKGPEIRTGMLKDGKPLVLERGSTVTITSDYSVEGHAGLIPLSYPHIARDMRRGDSILMADGAVMLEVLECDEANGTVKCLCLNDTKLGERKNCNLPGVVVDLPTLTEKDVSDLVDFGVKNKVDFIAASFVRKASDIHTIREVIGEEGRDIRIIAKVENFEGLCNYDEIVEAADGIMVARGDLGMEVPISKIFAAQKGMIYRCNLAGKPVITATQMLDSMISAPRPTRAEATDVANAVLDGTDCVMLSGETAAGSYPVAAVETMASICEEAEKCLDNFKYAQQMVDVMVTKHQRMGEMGSLSSMGTIESLASSAVLTATKVNAAIIVVLAATGQAARLIAKYRPEQPVVVGVVPRERRSAIGFKEKRASGQQVARQCLLSRGLVPVVVESKDDDLDAPSAAKACLLETIERAKEMGLVKKGSLVVSMYNVEKSCAVVRVMECE
mmetsp:Transcript_14651/g.48087  ORF Transcript_14651/g.48087 Transcript_14651/m.48087 type:complete len:609 (-) Transcript_14651:61-1887(-)|eukprot:CAMPEP_0170139552 /NCGR_PEP_ID=MMETSP0033_2-20121228/5735_1 /TAXON_ID=195969 /ORGANISM="Dolichomastix tenuilepis, Strain CCMP3274" /LENGTH=608 /DNA_ID=CAMNT_0010375683 /DNA_START=117 /DNA_END=1943 /DNA_ORIENTATION=+